jgi:hypothetical protein
MYLIELISRCLFSLELVKYSSMVADFLALSHSWENVVTDSVKKFPHLR